MSLINDRLGSGAARMIPLISLISKPHYFKKFLLGITYQ